MHDSPGEPPRSDARFCGVCRAISTGGCRCEIRRAPRRSRHSDPRGRHRLDDHTRAGGGINDRDCSPDRVRDQPPARVAPPAPCSTAAAGIPGRSTRPLGSYARLRRAVVLRPAAGIIASRLLTIPSVGPTTRRVEEVGTHCAAAEVATRTRPDPVGEHHCVTDAQLGDRSGGTDGVKQLPACVEGVGDRDQMRIKLSRGDRVEQLTLGILQSAVLRRSP